MQKLRLKVIIKQKDLNQSTCSFLKNLGIIKEIFEG